MSLCGLFLALLAVFGAQDSPPALDLRITCVDEVEFGRPFLVRAVRSWEAGWEPEAWQDEALAPLVVRSRSGPE